MGSAASAVPDTPESELQRYALHLPPSQREKLFEAIEKAEKAQEEELPHPGEEVLWQFQDEKNFYRPRDLVQLDGKEWIPIRLRKINENGTFHLGHNQEVKRERVMRYPPGMRPPQISGITLKQLLNMYSEHQEFLETPKWNPFARKMQLPTMYDVVPMIVKPATAKTKGSYSELFTQKAVDVFVSHWWGHEFSEFVKALEHAAAELVQRQLKDRDPMSLVFWICSFANAQWTVNLGSSLELSPFERALASQTCRAVVMVMDEQAMPLTRIWCIYEVLRTSVLNLPFYVSTKDGVLLGERVQENPALAQTLLALAEKLVDLEPTAALASNEEDKRMIVDAVSDAVGVPQFALAVQSSLFDILRQAGYALFSKNWALNFRLLQVHRAASREVFWLQEGKRMSGRFKRGPRLGRAPEERTSFHRAAQEGDRQKLKMLLAEEEVKQQNIKELNEQLKAVDYRKRYEIEQHIQDCLKSTVVHKDEMGQEAIHLAARYSDIATFQMLAKLEGDALHSRDLLGRLPLHRAAESGNALMVAAAVDAYRTDEILQEVDKKQHSALDLAVLSGSVPAVRALKIYASSLDYGKKRTALHLAAQWNHAEVLEALSTLGFSVDASDNDDTKPLHLAARFGHAAVVAKLLGLGATVTAATSFGRTALHWAALNGHVGVTQQLIDSNCPIDQRDKAGWTAFHWTLRRCHANCSRTLINGSANILMEDLKNQRSTLHIAACFNVEPIFLQELVEQQHHLTLATTDVAGKTPLHLSAQWGTPDVAVTLLFLKSDLETRCSHQRTPLYLSARRGNASVAYELLRHGADMTAADANGVTPMFAAARHNHFRVVILLLQNHADITSTEKDGMTVVHWAAKHGNCEALRALVAKSSTSAISLVSSLTRYGRSPLHMACCTGKEEAVKVLLQLRSDPTQRQKDGWMPMHLAARFGHKKVVQVMLNSQCDPDPRGVYGKTPAHCAVERGHLHDTFFRSGVEMAQAPGSVGKTTRPYRTHAVEMDYFLTDDGGRNIWHLAATTGQHRYFALHSMTDSNKGRKHILALTSLDALGRSPLHCAAAKGHHLVVKTILGCLLDKNEYDPRWDKKERPRYGGQPENDIEDLLNEEPAACPLFLTDHQGRQPLHIAAKSGFAQVTSLLAKFILQKMDESVGQLNLPDADGNSPMKLAVDGKHWEVVRRLVALGLQEPSELKEADALVALQTPLGSKVRVKEDFMIDSGKMLRKGEEGTLESCDEGLVTLQFVGELVTQTPSQFASCCIAEKTYLLNGSSWHRRARRPFPAFQKQPKAPDVPLCIDACADRGDFAEGDVAQGFEEDNGWLRLKDGFYLPRMVMLDETRMVPALTPWKGPSLRSGQLVRTREELTKGRISVPPGTVGLVRRIQETDVALVEFEGADRQLSLPGAAFDELELLPFVSVMQEPRRIPPEGTVALSSKRKECGQVEHDGAGTHSSLLFRLVFPDGSKSIKLSERRGLREIGHPPSVAQLATFVRRKELPSL